MDRRPKRFLQFGVADLLAAVAAVGVWTALWRLVPELQPMIEPAFLAVWLTSMCAFGLAAFMGRGQSKMLVGSCLIVAGICAAVLVRLCLMRFAP